MRKIKKQAWKVPTRSSGGTEAKYAPCQFPFMNTGRFIKQRINQIAFTAAKMR